MDIVEKQAFCNIYKIVIDFFNEADVEDEETYAKMCSQIEAYEIALPEKMYAEIDEYIREHIGALIYSHDEKFAHLYTEDLGTFIDGTFHLKDEHSTYTFIGRYLDTIIAEQLAFSAFAKEVKKRYTETI